MTEEQKGCYKSLRGCKDQIIIDEVLTKEAIKKKRNLSTTYIDYKKAFDSVLHKFLTGILTVYKIDPKITELLKHAMRQWCTTLNVSDGIKTITTKTVNINRGIFQGDALSTPWLCICLNPLCVTLDNSKYGYKIGTVKTGTYKLNHLLYMDDLKLYANSKKNSDNLLAITCNFSKSIAMELGPEKCKIINLEKGHLVQSEGFYIDDNQAIQDLAKNENYKYLAYLQLKGLKDYIIKDKLLSQFKNRINQILTTNLNSINIIRTINTFTIPLLTYSFGIVKWNKTELEELARIIRASLTKH
jgi:hypothetical protein